MAGYRIDRQMTEFGEHVRGWRMVLGLTAQQVAERADITRDTLRKIEKGDPGVNSATWRRCSVRSVCWRRRSTPSTRCAATSAACVPATSRRSVPGDDRRGSDGRGRGSAVGRVGALHPGARTVVNHVPPVWVERVRRRRCGSTTAASRSRSSRMPVTSGMS